MRLRALINLSAVLMLIACTTTASPGSSALAVHDAWVRPARGVMHASAAYLQLENTGTQADQLLSVSADFAAHAGLHESKDTDGVMSMSPVASIAVPAQSTVELQPGGYHIMLMGLTRDLLIGETVTLTLTFANSPPLIVSAEVRDE